MKKVLIIGGVAGGASAAARLRRGSEELEIILFEKGPYISYANCGLPYYLGGVIEEREELLLLTPEQMFAQFNVEVRTRNEVLHVDTQNKQVEVLSHETGERYHESYDALIISPGSTPLRPPIPGMESEGIFTLWTVPDADQIYEFIEEKDPKRAVVVGGGFIGLEMVENLVHRGIHVTLIERLNQVMAPLDKEMAEYLHHHLRVKGVDLRLEASVESFERTENGNAVVLEGGERVEAELILLSLGVRPQTQFLKDSGLSIGERGHLLVDEYFRTNAPDVYAIGDAVAVKEFITRTEAFIPLAGPANKMGRLVADTILGNPVPYPGTLGTSIAQVFDLAAGSTGLGEKTLARLGKKYGEDYLFLQFTGPSHSNYYPGAMDIQAKMFFEPSGKLLGFQAVGMKGIDKRVDIFAALLQKGGTVQDLKEHEQAYAPPYASAKGILNQMGFIADNILKGRSRPIFAQDMAKLDNPFLIDVREKDEILAGEIPGSVNIPLGELRGRLNELPKDRTIVVNCAIGKRGYFAEQLLRNNGFEDVYYLASGYRAYANLYVDYAPLSPAQEHVALDFSNAKLLRLEGMRCPGPIMRISKTMEHAEEGDIFEIHATDPGLLRDLPVWSQKTHNRYISGSMEDGKVKAFIQKGTSELSLPLASSGKGDDKTIVLFSGDLDKAIAALIIANGALAMGRRVTIFFTFWGLNALRKSDKVDVKKPVMQDMFSKMMPRGTTKMGLSRMNFLGLGPKMIRKVMENNSVDSLEDLLLQAQKNGVRLIACNMSMDLMGITEAELIDGVELGGVATYLGAAEEADTNLFI
ncbi:MAG: FAD-dependent oxidoreductase [Tissierellia bacterium]|nr:FAD-dependent oxidoreductase [Bacillota bacterium]NLL22449.1 FAD-dependent oxidoreductase [Tissierellia bacterium]